MSSTSPEPLFGQEVARATVTGAIIGIVAVMVASVAVIVLTGQSGDLLVVAALAAGFGGVGFGVMLGGVLSAVRVHANDEPGRAGRS